MSQVPRVATSLVVLLATLAVLQLRSAGEAVPLRRTLDSFPLTLQAWQGRRATVLDTDVLAKLKLTDYMVRDYVDGAGRVLNLYIGYWDTQRKGAQIHSPKNCLPGHGWEPVESSSLTVALPAPYKSIAVNRYLIQKEREQQVVLYWYQAQGQPVAGEVQARVAMVWSALARNRTDGAIVRIISPTYGSARDTTDRLTAYIRAMYPILGEYLPS